MGATLMRAPIAGSSQMLGSIGAVVNPDVHADVLASEAGIEVRLTQPPHPLLIVDVPSSYPEDLETFGTPDTVDIASDVWRSCYLMPRHVCCHVCVCRPWYICLLILMIV